MLKMRCPVLVLVPLLLWIAPKVTKAQVVDDFSDGDFTSNPSWTGEAAKFEVDGSQRLHLSAPAETDTAYLSVVSQSVQNASWEFLLTLDFNPSASNFARVYLVADNSDLRATQNGYYVRVGGETADRISLYRQDGQVSVPLITSVDGLVDSDPVNVRIRVSRTGSSDWELLADTSGGNSFSAIGTMTDTTHFQSFHFGVYFRYTSTRSDKFYFDDLVVSGDPFVDTVAPVIGSVEVVSATELDVRFNEVVNQVTAEAVGNYSVNGGIGNPNTVLRDQEENGLVHLVFTSGFTNGSTYQLTVSSVEDLSGNAITMVSEPFQYVEPSPAAFRDVVINEFMSDPSPIVGLAEAEFVEVFNASDNYIDLTGWQLGDATSFGTIGSHMIGPNEFALLVPSTDAGLFAFYPNVVTVTSFPSLNNAGDDVILRNAEEEVIDLLRYDLSWYGDEVKEDGGYSLEQVNPFAACTNPSNWTGSSHPLGGTPASENSVFNPAPDLDGPSVTEIHVIDALSLEVEWNESLEVGSVTAEDVLIAPFLTVTGTALIEPENQHLTVTLGTPVDTGVVYTVTISGIADCEGNPAQDPSAYFLLPFDADPGELVMNEVLFNPFTGGTDYVELVNRTARPINLKGWMLAHHGDDGISDHEAIVETNYAVQPNGFVAITEDTTNVMMNYINHGVGNFILADLPSYNNDSGTVYLLTPDSILSEAFSYSESMHFPLLETVDGVSLERLDADREVDDTGNWHSAAETVGFGTPGLENSQFYPTSDANGQVDTDPTVFSPDNDGHNDVLNINYRFAEPGSVGTIRIYDANGRLTKHLVSNELLGISGTYTWDGTADNGEKARIGMYVILFEVFGADGGSQMFKTSSVLGGRL